MMNNKIPKIIHYCWFGRNEKPADVVAYIETWKRYLPNYEIMEWNEENFDIETAIPYVKEAYEYKKWAFVSDYVRLYALSNYGGIYLDTDVQVFQSFDTLLNAEAFFGFESNDYVCTAVMASSQNHWFIREFLEDYINRHFIKSDGTLDMITTNVVVLTRLLVRHGLILNGKKQDVKGIMIYPQVYFSANNFINIFRCYKKKSLAYHHYSSSWYESARHKGLRKRIRHYVLGIARNIIGTTTIYKIKHKE